MKTLDPIRQKYVDMDSTGTVIDWFYAQAERTPEAVALMGGEETRLTYAELRDATEQVAGLLARCGLGPGMVTGLSLSRSPRLIVHLLAILRTGAMVAPLDPTYPPERLAVMAQLSEARLLIVEEATAEPLRAAKSPLFFADAEADNNSAADLLLPFPVPDSPCYLLFTSGSTGTPKGVEMGHRALANLIAWQNRTTFDAKARTLQFAPLSFDVSFQEIFATLAGGGTLYLISEDLRRDPARLLEYLRDACVERIFLPYVALQQLAAVGGKTPLSDLREVITAGEQLVVSPQIRAFFAQAPGRVLWNHYGPTETHVVTGYRLEGNPESWPLLPPIGPPIDGATAFVLDTDLRPVPTGDEGELCLGGLCLANGYRNRPDLTAERFITLPEMGRVYRTGDRARILPDSAIAFLGRLDDQVKVRGFRVEPGEIEQALLSHPEVREAAVVLRGPQEGAEDSLLVVYIAPRDVRIPPDPAVLRDHLASRLPEWMIPARFVFLPALPLTPSGKCDRRALPALSATRPDLPQTPYVAPVGEKETGIARIWAGLLGLDRVGANDNVFDLGATSLMAVKTQAKLAETWGGDIRITALFEHPTPRLLAAQLLVTAATPEPPLTAPQDDAAARAARSRQAMQRAAAARRPIPSSHGRTK